VPAQRLRDLSLADLRDLLRCGPIRFVVADVGFKPEWVPEAECFAFWKREVKTHLAEPEQQVIQETFPGGYCFFAAEWRAAGSPVVVLQRCH
jgi:hypothetical protein